MLKELLLTNKEMEITLFNAEEYTAGLCDYCILSTDTVWGMKAMLGPIATVLEELYEFLDVMENRMTDEERTAWNKLKDSLKH